MADILDRAADLGGKAYRAVARDFFGDWLQGLNLPGPPVFEPCTDFPKMEGRLFRLFVTSVGLTGGALGVGGISLKSSATVTVAQIQWIVAFALGAVVYWLYAHLVFRISLNIRRVFFIFSFVGLPWSPILVGWNVFTKVFPYRFGLLFVVVEWALVAVIIVYLSMGIRIVASIGWFRALFSVVIGAAVIVAALLFGQVSGAI